jgi:BNR repeat-like domain
MIKRILALCVAGSVSLPAVAIAAEGPAYNVVIDSLVIADTVTMADSTGPGFKAHLNFPYLQQRADGALMATYTGGQTQSGLQFGKQAISTDDGQTWSASTNVINGGQIQIVKPAGQFSRGFSVGFSTASPAGQTSFLNSSFSSTNGGVSWVAGLSSYDTNGVPYTVVSGAFGDIVDAGGGTWLMPAYGKRAGEAKFENILFESTDQGINWTRKSTISPFVSGLNLNMGPEGPTETSLLKLDNGDLLAVFRTGQTFPSTDVNLTAPSIFWAKSTDGGTTWGTAKMLGVSGSFPLIKKLDDGGVAMTYGRYGAKLLFADPTGTRWSSPTIIYQGPGSGHTEMRRLSDGRYAYVYDQSGFYPPPWNGSVPSGYVYDNDQSANLMAAILNITPTPVTEDYPWALEYHGDVTPDATAANWSAGSLGSVSARLWAELGQDYMRIETGSSGPSKLLNYQLPGNDPLWNPLSFQDGVVVDIRARVGDTSTDAGAASLLIGDGTNGSITLSLNGSSEVILEGGFGAGGALTYTDPGFSTLAWHLYRLIIQPDPSAGGQIRALLFVDGDMVTPILTQTLASSAFDGLIFGDRIAAENGIFEVDFLRFAGLAPPLAGDLDGDGFVGISDLNIVLGAWNQNVPPGNPLADPSGDGFIGIEDLNIVLGNWNAGTPPPASTVPEPGTGLLTVSLAAVLLRRRRR